MRTRAWLRGLAAAALGAIGSGTIACGPPAAIRVLRATYGANCQAAPGNATASVRAECDGKSACRYTVRVSALGDPKFGCAKAFDAVWRCPGEEDVRQVTVPAEAAGAVITLSCGR